MHRIIKAAAVAALTGALAVAAATPSQARHERNAALIGGLAAGAVIGAAAADSGYYYGPSYYVPGYAYEPGYAYAPGEAYAYEPAPVYDPPPGYYYRRGNAQNCSQSPASVDYVPCNSH